MKKTIAQTMKEFLDNNNKIVTVRGDFSGHDFNDILGILNETLDNFMVFNNAGGRAFHVWTFERLKDGSKDTTLKSFTEFVQKQSKEGYVYMHKINGKETIIRELGQ